MPDNGRFSEEEIEKRLRDLGARIDYPPTPDLASAVHRKLDAEEQPRRALRWPSFSAPRWMAVAAALVLISVVALSPALRTTLSDLFVPRAGLEAGGSAAKPESGGSEDRYKQEAGAPAQPAEAPTANEGKAATACPTPSIEAEPARTAAGAKFRLRGHDFSSGCAEVTPARGVTIFFRQAGETRKLMTLDADRALTFDTTLRVPKNAEPGRATVLANTPSGERAEARFVVLR
jgi:hypothetical protein